jgi:DNA ligase (NAD+)
MAKSVSPEKRVVELREILNRANYLYYSENRPELSDREFDKLLHELIDLERDHPHLIAPDSPTQRVGGDLQTELKPVKHAVPMMSIENTYNEEEVRAFDERIKKALGGEQPAYVLEPKIDGTSISLRYEDGQLVLGATRGRGNVGDDVTVNARTIKSIPIKLHGGGVKDTPPPILEVRGEVYMDNEDFQRVNKELQAEGEEPYANARNLTAGTLRRLDPKIVAKRRLRFLAHGLGQVEPLPVNNYWEWTQLLRNWGLPLPKEVWRVENVDDAIKCIHEFEKVRPKLPYMTDGMVMKVDDFKQRETLGANSKAPRWVIAYKYETEQQPTVLNDVEWQVGRTGQLTPVGKLEPVFISGVTVSNVTLHNLDQIQRLDLHLGDTIVVERSGEVIPYVADVLRDKRPKGARPVVAPENCPDCASSLERDQLAGDRAVFRCTNTVCKQFFKRKAVNPEKLPTECPTCGRPAEILDSGIEILCRNDECPGRLRERIRYFCGRSQMDIEGLGDVLVAQLVSHNLVKSVSDIFKLKADDLAELTHETQFGLKNATAMVESIQAAKSRWPMFRDELAKLDRPKSLREQLEWLARPSRLSLKRFGEKTIEQLLDQRLVHSVEDIFELRVERIATLTQTVRLGEVAAKDIVAEVTNAKQRGLARVLAALGIPGVGLTLARTLASWARTIDKLANASVDELAAALSSDPEAKRIEIAKKRSLVHSLFLPQPKNSGGLFGERPEEIVEKRTSKYLTKRDSSLPKEGRLNKARINKIATCFPFTVDLMSSDEEAVLSCILEGAVVAKSVHAFLRSREFAKLHQELKDAGVKLSEDVAETRQSKWTGKTVVITGSFEGLTRDEIKARLITLGAKVSGAVSSKTDALFVGEDAGSKLADAKKHGVPTYSLDVVEELMGGNSK